MPTLPDPDAAVSAPFKLEPKYDVVFRRLFDEEKGCRLLLSLLNSVLRWPAEQRLTRLSLLPSHVLVGGWDDKESVLDIRAEDQDGRQYDIEIHVGSQPAYLDRAVFYLARLLGEQLPVGEPYSELRPVIGVHFVDWNLFGRSEKYHHIVEMREQGETGRATDLLELHVVELARFGRKAAELRDNEEKWLYFLQRGHEMTTAEAEKLGLPEIAEAEEKLTMLSQDRILRAQYEQRRKAEHDRLAWGPGMIAEGRKEGLKEGRDEGLKEGLKEAVVSVCEVLGIPVGPEREAALLGLDQAALVALLARIKSSHRWD